MQVSLNIIDFLMLALVLQGFVLAILLLYSSKKVKSNIWLAALIFIISGATLSMEFDYSGITEKHQWLMLGILHFNMAIGPIIYFYTRNILSTGNELSWKSWLNFAPVILELKYQVIYLFYITGILSIPFIQNIYFLPSVQHMLFGQFPFTTLAAFISLVVYSTVTYSMILRHQKTSSLSQSKMRDIKWVKSLLNFTLAFAALWLSSIIVALINPGVIFNPLDHYILYIPAVLFVYLLGMAAYQRQNRMSVTELAEYTAKPTKTYFTPAEALRHQEQLTLLMVNEKVFLNPLLKVDDVATMLSIPEKALSNLLNQHIGKSFNDFVNEYRVNEAKKRLADTAYNNFTIAAIAFDCGFNSLATFQRVFKQVTNTTPSKYQNHISYPQLSVK
jgi:AraC-like DNA-binding protein